MIRIAVLMLFCTFYSVIFAADTIIGNIAAVEGIVKVKHKNSIKKTKVKSGSIILAGDLITTRQGASAKLDLKDNSLVVLDEKSTIVFHLASDFEQKNGKIYYKISSKNARDALNIKTPFAIIGIKGTEFIISAYEKDASVMLREGVIGVESIKAEFELYRKSIQKRFDDFKSEQESAYRNYKQTQESQFEFIKQTKKFELQEKKSISFRGNRVDEEGWSKRNDVEFAHFKALLETMK